MLTRRQFLTGLGAVIATAALPLGLIRYESRVQKVSGKSEKPPVPLYPDCDWVIDRLMIIDGSGQPAYQGKVAIKGQQIVAVGDFPLPPDRLVHDGQGLFLAPGFIDIHSHSEDYFYSGADLSVFLSQGVTAQIGGNCGRSPRDIEDYFATIPKMSINYGLLMGYATLRQMVHGRDRSGKTTADEQRKMREYLAEALAGGAVGLSVGLEYWPQTYATTEELIGLCEVVKEAGGFYATHIRSEYDRVLEAVEEAIHIGKMTGVPVQYSHIKAGYERNWAKFPKILQMMEDAVAFGLDITADLYAYTYSSTDLGKKPFVSSISEENLELALAHPLTFFGSDSGIYTGGRATHPRAYGNIPRILGRYVRERNVLSLEEAVAKLTSRPARRLGLTNRGLLKEGYQADMVLFDPAVIIDKATKEKPSLFSEGVRQVWVNGTLAWAEGKLLNDCSGQVLWK